MQLQLIGLDKQDVSALDNDDPDERSVFVKNVHFSATVEELKEFFGGVGEIKRVTIVSDKITKTPKGYVLRGINTMYRFAYIEYETKVSADAAK